MGSRQGFSRRGTRLRGVQGPASGSAWCRAGYVANAGQTSCWLNTTRPRAPIAAYAGDLLRVASVAA